MGTYVHGDKTSGEDDSHRHHGIRQRRRGDGGEQLGQTRRHGRSHRRSTAKAASAIRNLHMGNAMPTYSEYGYGYAVEKAPSTKGWSYPVFDELWNYGFAA